MTKPFLQCLISSGLWQKTNYGNGILAYNNHLPTGAIIGQVELVDTAKTSDIILMKDAGVPIKVRGKNIPGDWVQEIAFGDYSSGRYGGLLDNPVEFPAIIPAKGQLGIWEYDMPEKIGFNLVNGGHASFGGMPDRKTVEAIEEMVQKAKQSKLL